MSFGAGNGLVVGVADMQIAVAADKQLITYALGSCIGLTAYDPVAKIGGLLHFMLPQPGTPAAGAELCDPPPLSHVWPRCDRGGHTSD